MTTEQEIRLQLLRTILQHAYELARGCRYCESLADTIQEAYQDTDFVLALLHAEAAP